MVSIEILRSSPCFAGVGIDSLRKVAGIAELRTYPAGEELFREGDSAEKLYVLVSGCVDVSLSSPGREERATTTLQPGDVVSWSAVVEPYQLTASCLARRNCEVVEIDGMELRKLCAGDSMLGYRIMHQVARELARRLRTSLGPTKH